jgi:hypothetical protein
MNFSITIKNDIISHLAIKTDIQEIILISSKDNLTDRDKVFAVVRSILELDRAIVCDINLKKICLVEGISLEECGSYSREKKREFKDVIRATGIQIHSIK